MNIQLHRKKIGIALIAVVTALAIGYPLFGVYKKHQLQKTVTGMVGDTSAKLRDMLRVETDTKAADTPESLAQLDSYAAEADARLEQLRSMNASRNRALVDAAIDYMISARQLLRMQSMMRRDRQKLANSIKALRDHLGNAGQRSAGWIDEALRKKQQFEGDYSDVRRATETFGRLVETFPEARAPLTKLVDPKLLTETALAQDASKQALDALKRLSEEADAMRQLAR